MSVGRDYMVKKTTGPSVPKLFLDTRIIPRLVNTAGGAEVLLDRVATRTGLRPLLILAGAAGGVALFAIGALRRRSDDTNSLGPRRAQDHPYGQTTVL